MLAMKGDEDLDHGPGNQCAFVMAKSDHYGVRTMHNF
jgi:hypothetical protein